MPEAQPGTPPEEDLEEFSARKPRIIYVEFLENPF
jgi:hypothetical protein